MGWAAPVPSSLAPGNSARARRCLGRCDVLHSSASSLFAKLRYWKASKGKRVIADNCVQPCLSMKTAFLGFLPTTVDCQEKMLWALQMIWPYSGLVLVLYIIEKNKFFWLLNYLANFCPWCMKLHCLSTPSVVSLLASCVCQHVKEQAGPFGPASMSGWVDAASGWSAWCCVTASLQAAVPSVSFLCRHVLPWFGLNSTPGSLGLGCAGVTLLLLMIYIKVEMNILSIVFKARKQPEARTGNVWCLLGQLENRGPSQGLPQLVNARDGFAPSLLCFSENVS